MKGASANVARAKVESLCLCRCVRVACESDSDHGLWYSRAHPPASLTGETCDQLSKDIKHAHFFSPPSNIAFITTSRSFPRHNQTRKNGGLQPKR